MNVKSCVDSHVVCFNVAYLMFLPRRLSMSRRFFFFFNDTATTEIYTLSYTTLFRSHHDVGLSALVTDLVNALAWRKCFDLDRSEEHTSELQSQSNLVCRLLLEKK